MQVFFCIDFKSIPFHRRLWHINYQAQNIRLYVIHNELSMLKLSLQHHTILIGQGSAPEKLPQRVLAPSKKKKIFGTYILFENKLNLIHFLIKKIYDYA